LHVAANTKTFDVFAKDGRKTMWVILLRHRCCWHKSLVDCRRFTNNKMHRINFRSEGQSMPMNLGWDEQLVVKGLRKNRGKKAYETKINRNDLSIFQQSLKMQ